MKAFLFKVHFAMSGIIFIALPFINALLEFMQDEVMYLIKILGNYYDFQLISYKISH